jgi:predicted dithiol-disulfide oxidoreductase (DUF899 family)
VQVFRDRRGKRLAGGLFRGRSQLLIYHFMFGTDYTAGCAICSTIADGFNGFGIHLANHDVMLCAPKGRNEPGLSVWWRRHHESDSSRGKER